MKKIKIAFIGGKTFPSQTGVDRVIEAIVRELAKGDEFDISVYGDKGKMDKSKAPAGVDLIEIKPFGFHFLRAFTQFFISTLDALLMKKYDVIHLHNLEASFLLPMLRLKYPVISTSHIITHRRVDQWNTYARYVLRLMEWPFMYLSNIRTSVSESDTQYFENKFQRQITWIPNGVSIENYPAEAEIQQILKEYDLSQNEYILFVAGRVIPTKGAHTLLEAMNTLEGKIQYPVVLVGDFSKNEHYTAKLRDLASQNTRFISFIEDKKKIEAIIRGSKLFVFPSLVEGMSMVLLEAVMAKVPIIVSDIPENISVLEDTALFFQSDNSTDLAKKIAWSFNNEEAMNEYIIEAADHVVKHYSWESIVGEYIKYYRELIQN